MDTRTANNSQNSKYSEEQAQIIKKVDKIRAKQAVFSIIVMMLVCVIIGSVLTISYTVSGSMVPTLSIGEVSFTRRVFGPNDLKRGDIIFFNPVSEFNQDFADLLGNGKNVYVKRLIGLPGDRVSIKEDIVYINGEPLDEPYVVYPEQRIVADADRNMDEVTVPEGCYFFMGDNRDNSFDSRYAVGFVPYKNVLRKMMFHFPSLSAKYLRSTV